MNAIQLLRSHHREIEELFERLGVAARPAGGEPASADSTSHLAATPQIMTATHEPERSGRAPQVLVGSTPRSGGAGGSTGAGGARSRLFEQLADVFQAHATVEEQLFYPLARTDATERSVDGAVEDHAALKRLVHELRRTPATDPSFDARLHLLRDRFDAHVRMEEQVIFPAAQAELGEDPLGELGIQLGEKYRTLRGQERMFQPVGGAEATARPGARPDERQEHSENKDERRRGR